VPESSISFSASHLANQFLVAMPGMVDPNFSRSVIYLFEHTERGAMGLVVNRPTELDLGTLFDKIELKLEIAPLLEQPVYFGGPVQTERGFVLHESPNLSATEARVSADPSVNPAASATTSYSSSLTVPGGLTMTTSKDVLEAVAKGNGPKRFIMTLGYAGWGAGQLEMELAENVWLVGEPDVALVYDPSLDTKWSRALARIGISPDRLQISGGRA
jgi:putative transcriptional regulator